MPTRQERADDGTRRATAAPQVPVQHDTGPPVRARDTRARGDTRRAGVRRQLQGPKARPSFAARADGRALRSIVIALHVTTLGMAAGTLGHPLALAAVPPPAPAPDAPARPATPERVARKRDLLHA